MTNIDMGVATFCGCGPVLGHVAPFCGRGATRKMAASTFAWLSVTVKKAATIVTPRKIIKISWECSFRELLCATAAELEKDDISKVCISKNEKFIAVHEVDVSAPVSICNTFGCLFVCFHLEASSFGPPAKRGELTIRLNNCTSIIIS